MWSAITHPCPTNPYRSLVKPPMKLGQGWVIVSGIKSQMKLLIHALISVEPVKGPLVTRWYASMNYCATTGSGNGLMHVRRQAIPSTNADSLSIRLPGTRFESKYNKNMIFKTIHLKTSYVKWWSFCWKLNVLRSVHIELVVRLLQISTVRGLWGVSGHWIIWG